MTDRQRRASSVLAILVVLGAVGVQSAVRAQVEERPAAQLSMRMSPEAITAVVASARPDAPAVLQVANREVTTLRAAILGRSAADRVVAIATILSDLRAGEGRLTVTSRSLGPASVVAVGGQDVFAIVPLDTDPLLGETLETKSAAAVRNLQQALDEIEEANRPRALLWAAVQVAAATVVFIVALRWLRRVTRRARAAATAALERRLSRSSLGEELVRGTRMLSNAGLAVTTAAVVAGGTLAYVWVTFVLRRFPYTRPWGESLRALLIERASAAATSFVAFIPDLIMLALIAVALKIAIRLVHLLSAGADEGHVRIPGVYPETAAVTRKLAIAVLWFFAAVVAYPYLPGSDTDAFKGIGVFLGIVVSIGSGGLMNQLMSGFTVTYSRGLRKGDYVRAGDVEGTVTEIGTLSTKIETPRHEEVTIPNAVLVSWTVTNYTRNADTTGVFVPAAVGIGYDVPWRQVEALLQLAASRTDGVRSSPAPIVRRTALDDFAVRHTLFVCLERPDLRVAVLDRLHANILDAFNEHGVQIMVPAYEGDPGSPKVVPKQKWFSAPAVPPEPAPFKIAQR